MFTSVFDHYKPSGINRTQSFVNMKAIDNPALPSDDRLSSSDEEKDEAPYQTILYE